MNFVTFAAASFNYSVVYWPVAWTVVALSLFVSFLPAGIHLKHPRLGRRLHHPFACFAALGLTLLAFRWPGVIFPFTLNADESQLLAQAITLVHANPFDALVFYRSVQSGSAGPLLTFPLLLPGLFGLDIDYASGRVVGLLLLLVACILLYYTVRHLSGEFPARVAAWTAGLCFALSYKPDFIHYTSEHPSLPLLALCTLLFFSLLGEQGKHLNIRLFLLGASLAAVPFAKLQSTIVALTIAALAYLVILRAGTIDFREKLKRCAVLTAGGISVPAFSFALLAAAGVAGYFWQVYIVNNYHYQEAGQAFYESLAFYMGSPKARQVNYEVFFFATAAFIAIRITWWIVDREHRASRPWRPLLFAGVITAASWFAVIAPGRGFPHYLLLTIIPLSLVCGILMDDRAGVDSINENANGHDYDWRAFCRRLVQGRNLAVPCLFFPLLIWAARPAYYRINPLYLSIDHFLTVLSEFEGPAETKSAQIINLTKKPGDRLTVWGWRADYHVETQLPMGTRSACPEFQIRRLPLRDFYRRTALEEFKKNKPTFFIDAVGELSLNFDDRRLFGHYIFPELTAFIRENYTLVGTFVFDQLYVRNDRYDGVIGDLKRLGLYRTEP